MIGCGRRGSWIARLFQQHGGDEVHAVTGNFPHVAEKCGADLNVPAARRFSALSGYKNKPGAVPGFVPYGTKLGIEWFRRQAYHAK